MREVVVVVEDDVKPSLMARMAVAGATVRLFRNTQTSSMRGNESSSMPQENCIYQYEVVQR